jgi:hypothetical protein
MDEQGMTDAREEQTESGSVSPSKRAMLKAAWVAPVILSVALPRAAMAQGSIPPPPAAPPPSPSP